MQNRLSMVWRRGFVGMLLGAFLLSTAIVFAEPKPVLTLATTNPETMLKIAGKIAKLAGTEKEFESGIASFKSLNGFDAQKPIVFVLHAEDTEFKNPILYLPITDLGSVELPGLDSLMGQLKKVEDGKYLYNSPAGAFTLEQKKSYLVVSPESSDVKVLDDPTPLIAGLEKFSLGVRLDIENTSAEAIQLALAPLQFFAGMSGGEQAMQAFEQLNQQAEQICNEFRVMTFGLSFDPDTADTAITTLAAPKSGSEAAKSVAFLKDAKTMFAGFLGNDSSVAFLSGVAKGIDEKNAEIVEQQLDTVIDGLLEQVEENAEEDDDVELASTVAESLKKVIMESLALEKVDYGFSLSNDGTLLFAATVAETKELEKVAPLLFKHFETKISDDKKDKFDKLIAQKIKVDYTTVNGFRLSNLVIPVKAFADEEDDLPPFLAEKTLSVYWGLKDDAVALMFGFDPKAEETFKKAITATQSPVPVKNPLGAVSMQQLGKLLKAFQADASNEDVKQIVDAFIASGSDAKITLSQSVQNDSLLQNVAVSGKIWETVAKLKDVIVKLQGAMKSGNEEGGEIKMEIREFE